VTRSVARRVSATAVVGLGISLLAVGLATGALHHVREVEALDHALLAAAQAHAGSGRAPATARERGIDTWIATPDDDIVPPRIFARAASGAEPLIKDMGDRRLVLVPVDDASGTKVYAAIARRMSLARSTGALAGIWLATSAVILVAAGAAIHASVRRAFQPIDRARQEVARVMALGQGERVSTQAPVEIEALLVALNGLLDRLDRAHATQVRFVADAAHELRTPVTALLGELDVALRRERSAGEMRTTITSARDDVLHLRRLVEALTALARVDAGEVEAHKEFVRAADLAQTALDAERPLLAAASCNVALHADDDPELQVHRILLELALENLLRNAARHAPGSDVTFTVRSEGERVVFEVRDTGPGIAPELAEAVFERFARGTASSRAHPGGLGLGLPLAREVARRHGGDCRLKPIAGGGTRAVLDVLSPTRADGSG
jgi:two-component system, OmpR family, heavy metal sensor histidine kinase CusS